MIYSNKKKLKIGVVVLSVAVVCFCVCSFALGRTSLSSRLGVFSSGESSSEASSKVDVDINGGAQIIEEEPVINPGDSITREFYITNNDSEPVYYGFSEVEGSLEDFLNVRLVSGAEILFEGSASELEGFNSGRAFVIQSGEKKNFELTLIYPESAGNNSSNGEFSFRVTCDYAADRGDS